MTTVVLIVEDDFAISNVIRLKFERAGFEVHVCEDGLSAWEYLQGNHVDLMITDHKMPRMTGVELCEQIRNHSVCSALPIIMLTARKHDLPTDFASKSSIVSIISKPFSPSDLLRQSRQALEVVRQY